MSFNTTVGGVDGGLTIASGARFRNCGSADQEQKI